jgi:hypothetical protein
MSEGGAPQPTALLVHDGELGDVRALMASLEVPCTERRGSLGEGDLEQRWDLIVTTPQRAPLLRFAGRTRPTCIAVCDRDSRTLRNSLRRAGVGLLVRRPVHPAALRALVLHALYRGPERRRHARVPIGAPVSFRRLLRRRPALLADLSLGGCRLLTEHPLDAGRRFSLLLPTGLSEGRPLALRARVLRCWTESQGSEHVVTAKFEGLRGRRLARLERTLTAFAEGPATLSREPAGPVRPAEVPAQMPAADPRPHAGAKPATAVRHRPDSAASPTSAPQAIAARPTVPCPAPPLAEQAARVLLGRDVSLGGMRIERDPSLRPGRDVRLALHVSELDAPLVVTARVHRDEGARGMVLRFHALTPEQSRHLRALVDATPALDPAAEGDEAGVVVSELLEPVPAAV